MWSHCQKISKELQAEQKNTDELFSKLYSYVPEERYVVLPQDAVGKQDTLESAKSVESMLRKQGYRSGNNGVTISSLIEGAYQGKDYSPDAYYEKNVGESVCIFSTRIAYANPKPAAVNIALSCIREVDLF